MNFLRGSPPAGYDAHAAEHDVGARQSASKVIGNSRLIIADCCSTLIVRYPMRFVLHYRGQLRANGSPAHKHELRKAFHSQLKRLWNQPPLNERFSMSSSPPSCSLGPFAFVPLVAVQVSAIAELSIVLLRPEAPGQLITQGGDIDNRLKTLFDALTVPRHENALPDGEVPTPEQLPYFFCLLEDDNLVTSVSVRTEQLLEPVSDSSVADISIEVTTRVTRSTMGNGDFA